MSLIGLEYYPCDGQNVRLQAPVTLTSTDRTIRICLVASPSNAELSVPIAQVRDELFPLGVQIDQNLGTIVGIVPQDYFVSDPLDEVLVLGKADICEHGQLHR